MLVRGGGRVTGLHDKPRGCSTCGGSLTVSVAYRVDGFADTTWRCNKDHLTQTSDIRPATVDAPIGIPTPRRQKAVA